MQVLVLNSGSSSVKFELFAMEPERALLRGEIERVGQDDASLSVEVEGAPSTRNREAVHARTHAEAMDLVLHALWSAPPPVDIHDLVAATASFALSPSQPPTLVRARYTSGAKPSTIKKNCRTSL